MSDSKLVNVIVRDPIEDDYGFIYKSWLRSYRDHSSYASLIPKELYYTVQSRIVTKLIETSGIAMAVSPDDTAQIYGFGVYNPSRSNIAILHFLYVKHSFRNMGIASVIRDHVLDACGHDHELPFVATHETKDYRRYLHDHWDIVFNPFLIGVSAYG